MPKDKEEKNFIFIIVGVTILSILVIMAITGDSSDKDSESENQKIPQDNPQQKLARFEAEANLINEMMVEIVNRNDYEWTNIKVLANDYYNCIEGMSLGSNEKWTLKTHWCEDVQGGGGIGITKSLEKIEIVSDQGSDVFFVN